MSVVIHSTVKKIEEKTRVARAHKTGDEIFMERESLGWFVFIDGVSLLVGSSNEGIKAGDPVKIIIG
jgi:hypothetical protein